MTERAPLSSKQLRWLRSFCACLFGLTFGGMLTAVAQNNPPVSDGTSQADIIFIHGNIYTGSFSAKSPRAQAFAVRGDRIVAVGSDPEMQKLKGPRTQLVELGGHFVMPGFNDAHLHLDDAGATKLGVDLTGTMSRDEFRVRVRKKVAEAKPGEWIVGAGWDETLWPVKSPPTSRDLDDISAGHPIFLVRIDGHIAVASTRALEIANIATDTRNSQGGRIDRDEKGQATGILRETAQGAIFKVLPPPTHEQRRQRIELALADLAEHGITSAQDYSPAWDNFEIYEELEKAGKLTTRIAEWLPFGDSVEELKRKRASHPHTDLMLHTGMLKGFMDGSLGSHTAAMLAPYADDPKNSGLPRYDAAQLNQMTKERVLAGFQIGFHAIGDRGVQMALDAFAEAQKSAREAGVKAADGGDNFRLRVEHAQVTTPEQIVRFKALNVIASMQPNHLLTDMRWAQNRLGEKRASTSYAWKAFVDAGVPLAFGTDYPVEPVTAFRGIYSAVTRKSGDGGQQYFPEQRLMVDQAIAAYTSGAAFAEFAEKEKGKLEPGMLADFVELDRDITAVAPAEILLAKVLRTVVGGKTVFESK